MNKVVLLEEYRLVEKTENEDTAIWRSAHLVLFFMAFVFGSFCTFCFHMLMYMFDEKCVLFPKLMSLTSVKASIAYQFIPENEHKSGEHMPVDFMSTQWLEKSACYLPTYIPLVSSIFGLVWTSMFLMCNSGGQGFQRSWWVLPFVFLFSLVMSCVCVHSSILTQSGLNELCHKLSEITGNPTCTYTVNVATLAYDKQIKGVYQATRLTLLSAWLHTFCWILSALLTVARIILVVDFQLVKIKVELKGDVDKIMERHETQIRSIIPDYFTKTYSSKGTGTTPKTSKTKVYYKNKAFSFRTQILGKLRRVKSDSIVSYTNDKVAVDKELVKLKKENERVAKEETLNETANFIKQTVCNIIDSVSYENIKQDESNNAKLNIDLINECVLDIVGSVTLDESNIDKYYKLHRTASNVNVAVEENQDTNKNTAVEEITGTISKDSLEDDNADISSQSSTSIVVTKNRKKKVLIQSKLRIKSSSSSENRNNPSTSGKK